MPSYRYEAMNADGEVVHGTLAAESERALRAMLSERGLVLRTSDASSPPVPTLSSGESSQVIERVAELSTAGAPIGPGLRAAAAESGSARVSRALRQIADRIDTGASLTGAVGPTAEGFPAFMRGLVMAAARTGRLGTSLEELVSHDKEQRFAWWSFLGSLVYPALVAGMSIVILVFQFTFVVPQFKSMFEEFGLVLPNMTLAVLRISDLFVLVSSGIPRWISLGGCVSAVLCVVVIRLAMGPARWHRLLSTLPLFGPLWAWGGAASFARFLAVLLDNQLPLDEALELAASGLRDHNVSQACREYAEGVRQGVRLSTLVQTSDRLPQSLVPFIECGETNGDLAAGLREASTLFLARLQLRSSLLRSVSPAIIFVFAALSVALVVVALFFPLIDLIDGLA